MTLKAMLLASNVAVESYNAMLILTSAWAGVCVCVFLSNFWNLLFLPDSLKSHDLPWGGSLFTHGVGSLGIGLFIIGIA